MKQEPEKQSDIASQQNLDAVRTEIMVRDNIGWMLSVARRLLNDHALAEDAVQDAFMAAFRGIDRFEQRASLKTWLHRITVNAALMKLRQLKRRAEQPIDEYLPEFDRHDCRIELPWEQMASIEEILGSEQRREQIHSLINKLPDTYRIVLLLRDIEGYSTVEVAGLLDISESNVKVRLHRARAALKTLIEPILRNEVDDE